MKIVGATVQGDRVDELPADYKRVARFAVAQAIRLVKLSLYLDGYGSGVGDQVIRPVIYQTGGALFLVGSEQTIVDGQEPGWVDLSFLSDTYPEGVPVAAGTYDFGLIAGQVANSIRVYGAISAGA